MPEIPLAAAVLGSAIIGGGASIFGASKAASAQGNAANQANATQQAMFQNALSYTTPFMKMGADAIPLLQKLTTPGPDQTSALESTPGYEFALSQGEKGITNQATMSGLSGGTLKAGASFASGLASNTWSDVVNKLISQVGMGSQAAGGVMSNSTAVGGQLGANITGAGNAAAGADIAGANAISGGAGNISNALMLNALTGGKLFGKTGGSAGAWGSGSAVQPDPFNMPGGT